MLWWTKMTIIKRTRQLIKVVMIMQWLGNCPRAGSPYQNISTLQCSCSEPEVINIWLKRWIFCRPSRIGEVKKHHSKSHHTPQQTLSCTPTPTPSQSPKKNEATKRNRSPNISLAEKKSNLGKTHAVHTRNKWRKYLRKYAIQKTSSVYKISCI